MRKTLQKSAALLMLSLLGPAAGWAHSVQYSADITSSDPSAWTAEGTSSGTAGASDAGVKGIKAAAEATYPYTINFIESTDGWSAIDANGSGRTISKNSAYKYHVDGYDDTQAFPYMQDEYYDPANDYWVSPSFSFEAGKTYKAAFDVLQLYGANSYGGKVALELGKIGDDASSFKKIADLTLVGDDPQWGYTKGSTDPHNFQVAESGDYYVAAHVTGHDGAQTYVYLGFKGFSLSETTEASEVTVDFNASTPDPGTPDPGQPDVETKALPYNVDFSVEGSADAAEWTVVDKSATTGYTWQYGSKYTAEGTVYGFKIDDDNYNSDDYLISPAFKLEAGKTYNVDLTNYAYTYGADLFVEYGTNKDDVTTFTQLAQTPRATVSGEKITGPYELTVPADGVYYIALRAKANTSVQDSPYYTYLVVSSFGLSEKNGGSDPDQPEKPDVEGTLPYSVTFDSADKFDEWTAYDNSDTKGTTWEYSASDFAGKPSAGFLKKDDGGASDLLISPKFQLKEGKTYTIKVDMAASEDNGTTIDLNYFKGTKNIDELKSIAYIGSTLPVKDGDNVKDSWTLDVTQDGDYWFVFRVYGPWSWDAKQGTGISIYSVSITENADAAEDEAVALPYSTDFSTQEGTTGWTAMDRSDNTNSTWKWREGAYSEYDENWEVVGDPHTGVAFDSDNGTNANDYWVSPAFELTAGNTYKIKTLATTNRPGLNAGTSKLYLKLGTNKKVQSTFDQTIGNIALTTVYDRAADEFEFSPKESGKYYVAYNIYDEDGSNAYGYIFNFSIEEKVEPVAEIPYSITFDSADKFAEWSTIDHSDVPGVTWQYTASDFAGKAGATMGVDANSATCDFLVSPKFQLKGGKTYVFQADLKSTETNTVTLCLDYFKTVKDPESVNNVLWIGTQLPVEKDGQLTDSWTIDIPEDGNYWFALRALNWNPNGESTDGISVYSVNITEEKDDPVALPYSTDFSTEAGTKGWKALDASTYKDARWEYYSYGYQQFDEAGNTVGENHPCVKYGPEWDSQNVANDYYTSPAFTLEAGKTYVVSTLTTASLPCIQDGNTKLTLKLGKERMLEASYDTTIGEIALNNVYDRDADKFEFTVPETGVYHVAYNAYNNVNSNSVYVYAFNFALAEKEVVATAPVTELKAEELTDTKEVKLSWVNPTKDAKGNDLAADAVIDVNVYEGDKLLDTVDDAVPGALCDWTYAPETFEGTHSYKLVVVYNGVESEAATTELNIVVDGINGIVAIPAGAKVSVHTMDGALVGSDLQNLAKGTYIVTVKTIDGNVKTVKVNK